MLFSFIRLCALFAEHHIAVLAECMLTIIQTEFIELFGLGRALVLYTQLDWTTPVRRRRRRRRLRHACKNMCAKLFGMWAVSGCVFVVCWPRSRRGR